MKVFLNEIREIEQKLDLAPEGKPIPTWVTETLALCDEAGTEKAPTRPISGELILQRIDGNYVVSGQLESEVQLLCSRCLKTFSFGVHPEFTLLFTRDKNHLDLPLSFDPTQLSPEVASRWGKREGDDLDLIYIAEDFIDLKAITAEQVQIELPYQPLCEEDCKGLCQTCGANLNVGRCACDALKKRQSPFAVLKDFKKSEGDNHGRS